MSDLFVDNIKHQSSQGSGTITLGASGEKITTASGAEFSAITGQNYPAFETYLSAHQEMSDITTTKIEFDTERFDTNSYFDNSTNYRYTPLVAGKYNVYCSARYDARTNSNLALANMMIFKNGSNYLENQQYFNTSYVRQTFCNLNTVIDMNGSSDYLEVFAYFDVLSTGSGNPRITGSSTGGSVFGAYRIGE